MEIGGGTGMLHGRDDAPWSRGEAWGEWVSCQDNKTICLRTPTIVTLKRRAVCPREKRLVEDSFEEQTFVSSGIHLVLKPKQTKGRADPQTELQLYPLYKSSRRTDRVRSGPHGC
jgi:hypothetical protein